ncbi:hypothetical protein [Nocardiopsis ansamitocini]|uniref:Uncharacterized protein n=1 Tax=Nocardiopsis ansamitocini TaxID=1670832 RepID=A0A9W6P4W2_9ACTN|nr:hypothetical protein [Nocardiopsis ansamitocini]GLU47121.1 hypothetical protein Nans01_14720 [Nocardiopsis ansamitocini]
MYLISPVFSLVGALAGMLVAYVQQHTGLLMFCALSALLISGFLVFLLVRLYRQRQHGSTASQEP